MDKLTSLTDFVLQQFELLENVPTQKEAVRHINIIKTYANFLKRPLKLEMFVPCDDEGNVLEEPKGWKNEDCNIIDCCISCKCEQYQQAKAKVLFEGFNYIKELRNSVGNYTHILKKDDFEIYIQWGGFHISGKKESKTIEDLIPYNLTLTKNATNNEL